MGKRLDDLEGLNEGPSPHDALARERSNAALYLTMLASMLDDETYDFAWSTLESIRDQVQERQRITEGQIDAVENIKAGGDRQAEAREGWERHERRTGRRYEGWDRSRR